MATRTNSNHLGMIHGAGCNRGPRQWRFLVAGITEVGTRNMIRTLAAGCYAIMTYRAIIKEVSMIHARRHPGCRGMTVIAGLRGHDVRG